MKSLFNPHKMLGKPQFDHSLHYCILQQLYSKSPLACLELSMQLGTSEILVHDALSELIDWNYICQTKVTISNNGQLIEKFAVLPERLQIVKIAVDQLSITTGVSTYMGVEPSALNVVKLENVHPSTAFEQLVDLINRHVAFTGSSREVVVGGGGNGIYLKNFLKNLSLKTGLNVYKDHNRSLHVFAELKFGRARQLKNVLVVNLNTNSGTGTNQIHIDFVEAVEYDQTMVKASPVLMLSREVISFWYLEKRSVENLTVHELNYRRPEMHFEKMSNYAAL